MKKIAVFLISYDGIVNNYCGVGTSTRSFIRSFLRINKYFKKNGIDLSLNLVSPALISESLGYSEKIKEESFLAAKSTGGRVFFIGNGTDGMMPYGRIENWKVASDNAASLVLNEASKYDESIVFCFDTPFAKVPYNISLQKKAFRVKKIKSVLVFESDVFIHEPDNPSFERIGWEAAALKFSEYDNNTLVANTGEFISAHLTKNYGLDSDKFVDLVQGIDPELARYGQFKEDEIEKTLMKYGIPLNKKLIFSVGRAVDYKGFDILINAFSKIKEDAHLVFVASPYKTEASFVNELKKLLGKTKINYTAIFDCDFNLPKYICQWKNTKIVAQLSRREPFGLVPEEVRVWSRRHGPVPLASNKDGFLEQIEDGNDGFLVDIEDDQVVADKIDSILRMKKSQLTKIVANGKEKFNKNFDYRVNMFKCFSQLIGDENKFSILNFNDWLLK